MPNSIKFLTLSIGLILVLGAGIVLAQEEMATATIDITEELNLDEEITAQDLEVSEPNVLPDSPFYFLKEWGRNIQSVFTFNPIAKAKLKEKFTNEKLIEVKKMVKQNKAGEIIEKGIENYQNEMEEAKKVIERIKETAEENIEVGKFLDKFTRQQVLQERILQKLETQVPPEVFAKIETARQRHLEKFGAVMNKLQENKEELSERLEKNLEAMEGSQFKNFKNLEVLKELESKVPEEAKEAIQKAEVNALKRLKGDLEKMSPEDQEKFKEYLDKISGDKEKQLEILENLKTQIKESPVTPQTRQLKEKLEEGKTKIFEKIEQKLEKLDCPQWTAPSAGFCKEGRVVIQKDEQGCPLSPKCVVAAETCDMSITCQTGYTVYDTGLKDNTGCPIKKCLKAGEAIPSTEVLPVRQACITLWNPVCGKNGKTYSSECFAKSTGIEIDYKGVCKEKVLPTPLQPIPLQPNTETPSNVTPE